MIVLVYLSVNFPKLYEYKISVPLMSLMYIFMQKYPLILDYESFIQLF